MFNMFTWKHEYTIEVDVPLQKVWDYMVDPNSLTECDDIFESCTCEGELKTGAVILVKTKNRNTLIPLHVTNLVPHKEISSLLKSFLITQEGSCFFQPLSHDKTAILFQTTLTGFIVPFLKSFMLGRVKMRFDKLTEQLNKLKNY